MYVIGEESNGKQMFLVLQDFHSCVYKIKRNSWQYPWAIVVSRRPMLWSQVCIHESIHWAWVFAVKLNPVELKVLKLIMDKSWVRKAGESEKKVKANISLYNLPTFKKDFRQLEPDFSLKLKIRFIRRDRLKRWGRNGKARLVGWGEKGFEECGWWWWWW